MPSEDTDLLEFNQCYKSDKALFIDYDDLEYLMRKIDRCKTNSEKSSTTKVREHTPSGNIFHQIL